MVLRRTILDVGSHESRDSVIAPHVVCGYTHGAVDNPGVYLRESLAECDRAVRLEYSRLGIGISQILPAELTTEEKLLAELGELRVAAAALVGSIENYYADNYDTEESVMLEPVVWAGLFPSDTGEIERYKTLYNATANLAETLNLGALYDDDGGQEIGTGTTEQPGENKTGNDKTL